MDIKKLKRGRSKNISKLREEAKKQTTGRNYNDERIWKPTVDKSGNGYAVIRFLPATSEDALPWSQYWDHGFQGPTGKWYIEKSLTSIEKPDPVGEYNSELWNSGIESDKEIARKQKRRLHYVSNIYIVSDPGNPDNEGKVFLYQYGKKIFDKIMDAMEPEFEDEDPIDPFDLWDGANFKLKIRQVEGFRNYDKSEFSGSESLSDDDEELQVIMDKAYDLSEFVDPANYKSYEELKKKLYNVLELNNLNDRTSDPREDMDEEPSPKVGREDEPELKEPVEDNDDEDDETLSYFSQLANED